MRRRDFLKGTLLGGVGASGVGVSSVAGNAAESGPSDVQKTALIVPTDLRCESLSNPLGIDAVVPRLSWKLKALSSARNQVQTAYQVKVASSVALLSSGQPDLWDSGKVETNRQLHVEYDGRTLRTGTACFWTVEVWDGEGQKSSASAVAKWEMGLLSPTDWHGTWIGDGKSLPDGDAGYYENDPAPLLRRSFQVARPVRRARLYAAALGYHDLSLNGKPVSDRVLDPAWTSTDKRMYYVCHDVTDRLEEGENVLGVMLGNGWRNPLPLRMWGRINLRDHLPVGRPQFLSELVVEYEDGSSERISSDSMWRVSDGPLLRNSVYIGETYDARLEQSGWDRPGFDDSNWKPAQPLESGMPAGERCQAMPIPPIRITRSLSAVAMKEVRDGVYIFDFGQNFAGWVRLRVRGPRGTTVQMRMGELVHADGTLNPMTAVAGQIKGLREDGTPRGGPGAPEIAWQVNTYTLRGGEEEVYTPRFTFHGFRYVEVTGFPGVPDLASVEGLRLNTDLESVGSFKCSNEPFNKIQEAVRWTLLSNVFSVQSDCPAREKFQYGGDIVASSEMAIANYDMATFYAKAVSDHRDAVRGEGWFTETAPFVGISAANYAEGAGPIGWGLAHPLLVAQLYRYYGDRRIVADHFDAARTWVDLLEASSDEYIIDRCIGDHESLDPKPIELIATAQFYQAASMVADFAEILGRMADSSRYRQLAERIRQAFVSRFVEVGTGRVGTATQAAQAAALYLGLVPDSEMDMAVRRMVDAVVVDHEGHIATGIFGTKYLLNALPAAGHADVAYRMANQKTYPGWVHMLENGATTLWETWAQSDNVYSQNHPMFGSVSEWFFKCLGGLEPSQDAVGYDRFRLVPFMPKDLEWVDVSYASVRGTISSSWRREGAQIRMNISVPVNTRAIVRIPASSAASVREGGLPLAEVSSLTVSRVESGFVELELGSGRFEFTAPTA